MKTLTIVGTCVGAAILYGIVHDQVTARVCVEYFTIGHPRIFPTESPTWLALGWGVVATWWAGVLLGIPLAFAAQFGRRVKREPKSLVRPIAVLLFVMGVGALLAGFTGYALAKSRLLALQAHLAVAVPQSRHAAFIADGAAHLASYAIGFLGGIFVIGSVWRSRSASHAPPKSTSGSASVVDPS